MSHVGHAMLSPVLETLKTTLQTIPFGNHTQFERMAKTELQANLDEICQATEATPEETREVRSQAELLLEALSLFVRNASNLGWKALTVEERKAKVQLLKDKPQVVQRSEEWFRQYGQVLTASEFSALFVQNKRRKDLAASKANPCHEFGSSFRHACPTDEMSATSWGIRFEPVVKQLLEHHDKCSIYELGRLSHATNTHLAASPDGIVEQSQDPKQVGRLVEIKCPYSRQIGREIPSDYWIQMQIQMEVADVDECEYIECELVSRKPNQTDVDLSGTTFQGVVYLLKQIVDEDQPFEYKYVYGEIGSSQMPEVPDGFECIEEIPWGLRSWHRKLVHRDRAWYQGTLPWQEAFWQDVETLKKGGSLGSSSAPVCLITDD